MLNAITILGFIALVVDWLRAYFRSPSHELWYQVLAERVIVPADGPVGQVKMTVDDVPIADPHTVTLHVWSTGRHDIESGRFDRNEPIRFNMGAPIVGEVSVIYTNDTSSRIFPDQLGRYDLILGPGLLRRTFRVEVKFLVDGEPRPTVTQALVDTEIHSTEEAEDKEDSRFRVFGIVAAIFALPIVVVIIAAAISTIVQADELQKAIANWVAPAFFSLFLSFALITSSVWYPTKWARAMRKRGTTRWARYEHMSPFDPALMRRRRR